MLLHVDDELGYVYTPVDLALFRYVNEGIRSVQTAITDEVQSLRSVPAAFIERFSRGTKIFPLIEALGSATDLSQLESLADLEDGAEERREQLQHEVAALRGNTLDERLQAIEARSAQIRELAVIVQTAASFNRDAYETARESHETARAELRRVRSELFADGELPGPADDQWQRFVGAADEYRRHLELERYPETTDECLYCGQALSPAAVDLIRRYRTFLDDSLGKQVSEAQRRLTDLVPSVAETEFIRSSETVERVSHVEPKPAWFDEARGVLDELRTVVELAMAAKPVPTTELATRAAKADAAMQADLDVSAQAVDEIQKQRADRATALAERQRALQDLEAQLELRKQLPAIRGFVEKTKQAQLLDQLGKRISSTTLRSLTDASKIASEELVNQSFEQLFLDECLSLRAPKVRLEFQGRGGRAERRKVVARGHRPSAVLSEGEIKALALADFLAECRMRGTKAPIVFDDPVTSLDYRRIGEVAGRIALLAETHQVVVFTHNIWLTTLLLSTFEKKKERCSYYTVRDTDDAKGVVSAESGPRQDTPAAIGKRINELIAAAKKADPAVLDALLEKGYDHLRSWCEAFVEQELLAGVTQRYQPNVMMTKLRSIRADQIPTVVEAVEPLFDKACRYMGGHSQPLEQLNARPTLTELESDWSTLTELRKQFLGTADAAGGSTT